MRGDCLLTYGKHHFSKEGVWANKTSLTQTIFIEVTTNPRGAIVVVSRSYSSWIYNYLCNQCISPLKL